MNPNLHPTAGELKQFLVGSLAPQRQAEIEQHILKCRKCSQLLESVSVQDDTLVAGLRGAATMIETGQRGSVSAVTTPPELSEHSRYRVVSMIGRGGMGSVYKAEHKLMERTVALKVISSRLVQDPKTVERFRQEARTAGRLDHPNIVRAFDYDQAGDLKFFVMEFVEGEPLDRLVARRGRLPVTEACDLICQAADGLEHAHHHGMVHRDIKPHNLMLARNGVLKILDFGLARFGRSLTPDEGIAQRDAGSSADGLTTAGMVLGTPDYIAPEQISDAREADVRADIYSLGCTLYFLLAGHTPFPQGTRGGKLKAHLHQKAPPLSQLRQDVPPVLSKVVQRMMAKDPNARFQTPAEARKALTPFAFNRADTDIDSATSQPQRKAPKRRKTRLIPWLAAAAVACCLAGLLIWGIVSLLGNGASADPVSPGVETKPAKVLIVLPHQTFYPPDVEPVRDVLKKAGLKVEFASSRLSPAQSFDDSVEIQPHHLLQDVQAKDFEAVVFTGTRPMDRNEYLGKDSQAANVRRLVDSMLRGNKYVAALCRGNLILADADVLKRHNVAVSKYLPNGFAQRAEARRVDQPVVVSGQIVTGRDPEDAQPFAEELARLINRRK